MTGIGFPGAFMTLINGAGSPVLYPTKPFENASRNPFID
jgi:hypothetical protein